MILVDEARLPKSIIAAIGEAYDIVHSSNDEESYDEYIDKIIERFYVGDKGEIIDFFKKI